LLNVAGRPREPLKHSTASLDKDKLVEPVQFNEKTDASAKMTQVPETKIVEVNVDNSVTTEKTPPLTRQPQMILKTSSFVRAVVSSILIGFPLLFIRKFSFIKSYSAVLTCSSFSPRNYDHNNSV
jgi:hypothetical protein